MTLCPDSHDVGIQPQTIGAASLLSAPRVICSHPQCLSDVHILKFFSAGSIIFFGIGLAGTIFISVVSGISGCLADGSGSVERV